MRKWEIEKNGEVGMRNAEWKRMRKWEGGKRNAEVEMRKAEWKRMGKSDPSSSDRAGLCRG